MKMNRNFYVGVGLVLLVVVLAIAQRRLQTAVGAQAAQSVQAPMFQVDAMWPKPLPNHWVLGSTIGLSVDSRDHVWITHRPASIAPKEAGMAQNPPLSELCCLPAPPVLEFDPAGNLVSSWGGPGAGYEWPESEHGLTIDYKDNVWIGGNGAKDHQVLKFTRQGKFLLQIGHKGQSKGSNDLQNLNRPAEVEVDRAANEVFIADGYGNRRVIVFDADTGAYKRHWGAYGKVPDDANPGPYKPDAPVAQQFRTPVHCAALAKDGQVYVCDRANNRIQVFKRDGTFVKEAFIAKRTLGDGAIFDVGFSKDTPERFLYTADGANNRIWVLLRDPLQIVNSFGDGGRYPGLFYAVHNVAVDSKGNIYTVETYEGKRVQKFAYKGLGAVPTN